MGAGLAGKKVLITGASSGIGWHLALEAAARGAHLALVARRLQRLEELRDEISRRCAVEAIALQCDVSQSAQVEDLRRGVEEAWGGIDILVNNAGRGSYGPFATSQIDDLNGVVNTNLLGVIYCSRAFVPNMLERGSGHLVFISSVLGELPAPDHAVYGATKFAVSGFAESLDYELSGRGIKVSLVEPGLIKSEFAEVSGMPASRFQRVPWRTPAVAARLIVAAIESQRRYYVPDRLARFGIALRRHLPRLNRVVFGRLSQRVRAESSST